MSLPISKLKEAKTELNDFLHTKFDGSFNIFYSAGTHDKDFKNQFLKIETNLRYNERLAITAAAKEFLVDKSVEYESLNLFTVAERK
jgi:hypothetical protein